MKRLTLLLLTVTINLTAQALEMQRFPLLEPISNTIPESFIIEGGTNELIMFWIDSTDLNMSKSLDDGANWNTPITLVDNTLLLDSLSDLNALKLNSGRILVTYKHKFHYSIYSDDNGQTWSEPIQLVTDIGTIKPRKVYESSLSQTDDGKIWFVYNRLNIISNIKSDDGVIWTEKDTMIIFESVGPHFSSVNSHWNGSLILIYQHTENDTSDIYESVSVDSGKTWSEPRIILDDGINKQRPRVYRDSNNNLWLTFTKSETTPFEEYYQSNIYYSKLPDGAYSWGIPTKFTQYVGFDGWQNINFVNNKYYITFTSNREGKFKLWYGIAGETNDLNTPPAIYNTDIKYLNDYPNTTFALTAKVNSTFSIDSVYFSYSESDGKAEIIQLFDDGLHNDSEADDFIFGNYLTGIDNNSELETHFTAIDINGNRTNTVSDKIQSPYSIDDDGEAFAFDNNNIWFPIDSKGVLADVTVMSPNGKMEKGVPFDESIVLYSAGFQMTGNRDGTLWGNGMTTTSRIKDYIHGNVDSVESLNQIYVVRSSQPDFYQSWIDWKNAVKEGARFYDGDGDGVYNPVDLNGNDIWDVNEDKPDILGDITAYTVFNDGVPSEERTFAHEEPQGIEIRETVFSYDKNNSPKLANSIFVRYVIENMGTVADKLDSVYFGVWTEMDIGVYSDDLVGVDSTLNANYSYNDGEDELYGINAPSCLVSILQGPPVYIEGETFVDINGSGFYEEGIDTPLDTAINRKGELLGLTKYPGAKNNGMTASNNRISSHPTQSDPDNAEQLRHYMLGYNQIGELIDPCNWFDGKVLNEDCSLINPRLMYSGDPVTQNGWICRSAYDQRQLGSIGPFDLAKGKPVEIIVAYIVGRGATSLESIDVAKDIAKDAVGFYNTNFSYVPVGVKRNSVLELPAEFKLMQNYPNPFNPSTTIKYSIPNVASRHASTVQLRVYDILGRVVTTLVNQQQKAGSYEVIFDASSLTSGIYFYRLQSGNFNESKKMILLK